jgi:hypothetical protein
MFSSGTNEAYFTPANPLQYPVKTVNDLKRWVLPLSVFTVSKGGFRRGAGGSGMSMSGS